MARHIWSVLCERVLVDAASRSVSLIEVAGDIAVEGEIPRGGEVDALCSTLDAAALAHGV